MVDTERTLRVVCATLLVSGSLAWHSNAAQAAPHPDDPPLPAQSAAAPASASMPLLGRAHRHGDGHRCEVAHAPVTPMQLATQQPTMRPLPGAFHFRSEADKAERLRRNVETNGERADGGRQTLGVAQ